MTKLMREKATGKLWAIKYITRGEQITDLVRREIVNHQRLRHPFVVRFKEVLVTETHLGVVMDYVGGGGREGGRDGTGRDGTGRGTGWHGDSSRISNIYMISHP